MIVIGADAHKGSHALAAVDAGTGVQVAELEIKANEDGHGRMLRWARALPTSGVGDRPKLRPTTTRTSPEASA
jgi:hypothetical protein